MRTAGRQLLAGATVAAVLLPQALAYAELAGVPAERGLLAGAVAATLGALAGSSPYLQTGPTALASLLTLGVLSGLAPVGGARYTALAAVLAVLVGLVRLAAGWLSLGNVSYLLSRPVIAGLSTGAGVLIVASQIPGLTGTEGEGRNPVTNALHVLADPGSLQVAAVVVGVVAVVVMLLSQRYRLPSALLALGAGMLVVGALPDVPTIDLSSPVVGIDVGLLSVGDVVPLAMPAVVIGFVGFGEVAAIARSTATRGREHWSPDRELLGQGLASVGAGLAGGFPVSGSFSRSSLNRMAGAASRWAAVMTGLLALAVLPFAGWVPPIPRPALAAVVAVAGAGLIELEPLRHLYRNARLQFTVAAVTVVATILLSPRVDLAVLVGVAAAAGAHVFREERVHVLVERRGDTLTVSLHGVLFYLSIPRVEQELGESVSGANDVRRIELDLGGLGRVDVSGALALTDLVEQLQEAGFDVRVVAVPPPAATILGRTLGRRLDLPEPAAGGR